jgi:hypothetical protein
MCENQRQMGKFSRRDLRYMTVAVKCQPVEPAIEVRTSICSNSVKEKGFWLDLKARGPSGISAPTQNLLDLLPARACTSGKLEKSCKVLTTLGGDVVIESFSMSRRNATTMILKVLQLPYVLNLTSSHAPNFPLQVHNLI